MLHFFFFFFLISLPSKLYYVVRLECIQWFRMFQTNKIWNDTLRAIDFNEGCFPKRQSIETILISRIYFEDFIIIFQTEF